MKGLAVFAGVLFVALGVAGFVPALCPDGRIFGVFAANEVHEAFYVATGILAFLLAFTGGARTFFRIAGIVYALVAVAGFAEARGVDFGSVSLGMNMADDVLHGAIALISLWLGFFHAAQPLPPPGPRHDLREWA